MVVLFFNPSIQFQKDRASSLPGITQGDNVLKLPKNQGLLRVTVW